LDDVRYPTLGGLKAEIASGPKSANSRLRRFINVFYLFACISNQSKQTLWSNARNGSTDDCRVSPFRGWPRGTAMIFWSVYLFFIGFLIVSAIVVSKADMSGPSKLLLGLIAVTLAYGFYKFKYPTYTYRYRMTVEVDAGGQTQSGSSVIEVTTTRVPQILTEVGPYERSAEGQAIFIELPDRNNIVALLASGAVGERRGFPVDIIPRVFRGPNGRAPNVEDLPDLRGRRELTKDQFPTLVTVSDPNDARTARVVDGDSLGSTLGVHLRSISVEMTKAPVTPVDIERHLPFLVKLRDQRLENRYPGVFSPFYSSFARR
jgi:hypothetical protein